MTDGRPGRNEPRSAAAAPDREAPGTPWRLRCGTCGGEAPATPLATTCEACDRPLLARYRLADLPADELAERWAARPREEGMWRFRELLPLRSGEAAVSLGEGATPLLPLERLSGELGLHLLAKDESRNPTGSFKDRGLSAAVTRAAADGAPSLVVPSAGNAAAALAAYGARAGLPVTLFIPRDTPPGVERRCRHYGAEIVEVDGLIDACGRRAAEHAAGTGAFPVSTLREPYRVEGKKTMMLEILESLGWRAPDAIVYPTGSGTGLIASWKVLTELSELGLVAGRTRLFAVQSTGCAPVVRAWEAGEVEARPWEEADTRAWGLRVPSALGDRLILGALRASGGGAVAVPDEAMEEGAAELGEREGVSASIEGGATLAAARRLRREDRLGEDETVVLFNTGGVGTYGVPREEGA